MLSQEQRKNLLEVLQSRFEKNMHRHADTTWANVLERLEVSEKLWSLAEMDTSGGEPDVVGYDLLTLEYIFFDCSTESPTGRRSICYDQEALASRKENKPKNSAVGMAAKMGFELLDEDQYQFLQTLGSFDTKTSSWIEAPQEIRALGGAIFGDCPYGKVFIYHNGAESYLCW